MSPTQTGMAVGAVLAVVGIAFGFGAFLFAAVAIAIGALVGRYVSGELDVSGIVSAVSGKRSSS